MPSTQPINTRVALSTQDFGTTGATLSSCGIYRFALWRQVQHATLTQEIRSLLFVMNNPSTADAREDDSTIRRVKGFAWEWGFHRVYVGNTNPVRGTDPKTVALAREPWLLENDRQLRKLAARVELIIAAWGNDAHPSLARRAYRVVRDIKPIYALGLTKAGNPKHPLYLAANTKPTVWTPKEEQLSNARSI